MDASAMKEEEEEPEMIPEMLLSVFPQRLPHPDACCPLPFVSIFCVVFRRLTWCSALWLDEIL